MKLARLVTVPVLVLTVVAVVGCAPRGDASTQGPSGEANLSAQQSIERIQNDPKVPEGLKRIKTDTLRHQPGVGP